MTVKFAEGRLELQPSTGGLATALAHVHGRDGCRWIGWPGDTSQLEAARAIDATGKVVCPGFIDVHAHSGLVMLAEPYHEPKVRQGVTTELIGIDGCSYAPFRSHDDFHRFVEMNSGLDGNPPLPGQWSTVEQYLDMFNHRVAVNVAYILGNSPVRICAMGWEDRRPTAAELTDMKAILREGMEEGGYGISTGLDYPPGSYADTAELVELSREAARLGGIYHTHVRYSLGDRFLDPFKEALDIGRQSGIPIHITHFYQRTTSLGGATRMLGLVEDAREEGMDVTFDSYPYAFSSTRLLIVIPQWAHNGGPEHLKEVLRAPEMRDRMRAVFVDDNPLSDWTLPLIALVKGKKVSNRLRDGSCKSTRRPSDWRVRTK